MANAIFVCVFLKKICLLNMFFQMKIVKLSCETMVVTAVCDEWFL